MSKGTFRPSVGFIILLASYSLLVATLAWGFSSPELERVWQLAYRMQRKEFRGLTDNDLRGLKIALGHYPSLTRAFIGQAPVGFLEPTDDGWLSLARPHLLRTALSQSKIAFDVECEGSSTSFPVVVILDRQLAPLRLRFTQSGTQKLELPLITPAEPELIPITVESSRSNDGDRGVRIRLTVREPAGQRVPS